jgi:hypothetical protein
LVVTAVTTSELDRKRASARKRQAKRRARLVDEGRCVWCGQLRQPKAQLELFKDAPRKSLCGACMKKRREQYAELASTTGRARRRKGKAA